MAEAVKSKRSWRQPSSKSGNKWTGTELAAFEINIQNQNSAAFFGVAELPPPNVPTAILNTLTTSAARAAGDAATLVFLSALEMANKGVWQGDADAFAVAVLQLMGYQRPGCYVRCNMNLSFTMCGDLRKAQTDVCVVDAMRNDVLLVLQEDKRDFDELPEGQLVAEAIAAFTHNNLRRGLVGDVALPLWTFPGIIMRGTTPIFYKITVTQVLVDCVRDGEHPIEPTILLKHVPMFPDGPDLGMAPVANRRLALQCYEAFKAFVFQSQPE